MTRNTPTNVSSMASTGSDGEREGHLVAEEVDLPRPGVRRPMFRQDCCAPRGCPRPHIGKAPNEVNVGVADGPVIWVLHEDDNEDVIKWAFCKIWCK